LADSCGIKPRIDAQDLAVVLRESVDDAVIRVEKKAGRSPASAGRLNTREAEPGGHQRGGSIQIGDFVRLIAG